MVSFKHHFTLWKEAVLPMKEEAGWVPESVWVQWGTEKSIVPIKN